MEAASRIFSIKEFIRPSDGKPVRSVVMTTEESVVVVWHVPPGEELAAHIHPNGQDTWTVISGSAEYFQGGGVTARLKAGEIAVAKHGQVHGVLNSGPEPFIFVSVVALADAGYVSAER